MGFVTFSGACIVCGKLFSFHPNKVPSILKEPICEHCIKKINKLRKDKGMKPIPYSSDAYDVAHDEEEINWGY